MSPSHPLDQDLELDGIPSDFETIETFASGLDWGDVCLIRERLKMSPTQRLEAAQSLMRAAARIRAQNGL